MKRLTYLCLVGLLFVSAASAARGESVEWTRQLGTSSRDKSFGVSADGLGNVYFSGYTYGSLGGPFAGGIDDAFVSKYDAAGNFQWSRQLGTSDPDESYGVSADGLGNVYISGFTQGSLGGPNAGPPDAFVSKYDAAGNFHWARQLGTSDYDYSYGVSADGLGNVYISGVTQGSLGGPSAGGSDAFVSKYDAAGTFQWSRQLGTSSTDESNGVSADGLGNVYISGFTFGSLGGPNAGSGGTADAFVSKYDAAGTLQWTRQLGTISSDFSYGVSADSLGNVYISGRTIGSLGGPNAGSTDAFVSKYDAAGLLQWSRQLGTSSIDESNGVSADGLGNVYFSGRTLGSLGGPNAGDYDAFVVKIVDSVVPEPNTLLLLCIGSLAVLWRRRGLVCASILAVVVGITCADRANADTFGSGANTFDIEFVHIGNPGNAADTTGDPNPAGSVPYTYRIGKYEISVQMIDRANTLGGLGLLKDTRGPDKPATAVSWNGAARFVNWLNTTSGSTPAYKFAIQPGEVGYVAEANIQLWTISDAGYNPNNLYRNSQAKYFLPSVDEWYKAAYFDPSGSVYYDYPTGSDSVPDGIDFAGDPNFDAVFRQGGLNPEPNDITNVGVLSPYGTAGQGGNVWEQQETDLDLVNGPTFSSSLRWIRGGSWSGIAVSFLLSTNRFSGDPQFVSNSVGFRVASIAVPEPSTLLLLCFGSLAVLWRRRGLACASILVAVVSASSAQAVTIDMVNVGNPGNAADTEVMITDGTTGYGSVGYAYQIGKYEVTAGQYTEFLNAVADADPNGLYNTNMGSIPNVVGANIQRTGSSPTYSYSVAADWANRPVIYVSFWDAARFANWLHNGQPTGAQGPGTTEDGAYINVGNQAAFARQAGALFFIPTEDEWYKASYHDKTAGLAASYYDYPTGSNTAPINTLPDPGNHANFYDVFGTGHTIGSPYYRTEAGAFLNSASPYGTFDQGGNVFEWNETKVAGSSRGLRGGSFSNGFDLDALHASYRYSFDPTTFEHSFGGFRVASIPEPSTLLLLCFGSLAVLWRRRAIM